MTISIIIPVLNEEKNLERLLPYLKEYGGENVREILVVDGGSKDSSIRVAVENEVIAFSSKRCRASQMNAGAARAIGDVFYFVHADSLPPKSYAKDILDSINAGHLVGCYRFKFDSPRTLLKINSYFTRFDRIMCRGGDQTLYVKRKVFEEFDGYNEKFRIMEEYDFIKRVRRKYRFRIIPDDVIVSARKYEENSYIKVNFANLVVFTMYRLGYSQDRMLRTYYRLLRQQNYNFDLK